jgi:hypothetical protein
MMAVSLSLIIVVVVSAEHLTLEALNIAKNIHYTLLNHIQDIRGSF